MIRLGLHDTNADTLESDDLARMQACRPGDIVSLHHHRDRWGALARICDRLHARLDFRGPLDNPEGDAEQVAALARRFPGVYSFRARNEPNIETPGATPDQWYRYNVAWLRAARRLCPPGTRLAVGAISPDWGGAWTDASIRAAKDGRADLLDWHAYGDLNAIDLELSGVRARWSGPLLLTETNPGLSAPIDFARWAADLAGLRTLADRLGLLGVVLFTWQWVRPESPNVPNVKGSPVEAALKRLNATDGDTGGGKMPVDPKLSRYGTWAVQHYNAGGDPRDLIQFARHILDTGGDPTNLSQYGVPDRSGLAPDWHPVDLRGQLPTRAGVDPYKTRPLAGVGGATIHYTASPRRAGLGAILAIAAYQTGPGAQEDFPAIAYHLIVDGDGTTYLCHDLSVRVWHSGAVIAGVGRNASHVGICYIGSVAPTPDQIFGLAKAVVWSERQLGKSLALEGHRDAPYKTTCPGPEWPKWRGALEQAIRGYR